MVENTQPAAIYLQLFISFLPLSQIKTSAGAWLTFIFISKHIKLV